MHTQYFRLIVEEVVSVTGVEHCHHRHHRRRHYTRRRRRCRTHNLTIANDLSRTRSTFG